jgi:hypothetical protein
MVWKSIKHAEVLTAVTVNPFRANEITLPPPHAVPSIKWDPFDIPGSLDRILEIL